MLAGVSSLLEHTKQFAAKLQIKGDDGAKEGTVQALFSVFNEIDSDGDVVLPSFFTEGQEVAMSAWGHNWGDLPPGKGIVRVRPEGAVFDGSFFLSTPQGLAHFETIKAMGGLQEWSFGFRVTKGMPGQFNGQDVRFLEQGELYEASPVLIGANRNTRTLGVKGQPFLEHIDQVQAAFVDLVQRSQELASLRAKEGRVLSAANRTRIASLVSAMADAREELAALLDATDPEKGRRELDRAFMDLQHLELNLVRS